MTKKFSTLFLVLLDFICIEFSIFLTWFIIHESSSHPETYYFLFGVIYFATYILFGFMFNMYNRVWQYASTKELLVIVYTITLSVLIGSLLVATILTILKMNTMIEPALIIIPILFQVLFIGFIRFVIRILNKEKIDDIDFERVLIFGAGRGGTTLARQMIDVPKMKMKPIIFLDDDKKKQKKMINGIKVVGTRSDLARSISKYSIDKVVIAIPSLARYKLDELNGICTESGVKVQIMPNIDDILTGKKQVSYLKKIDLEDLLGRESVKLDSAGISEMLNNKTLLITGAGGSIGSEIVRQASAFGPKKVILLGHGENSIYNIAMEMKSKFKDGHIEFIPIIADIQDKERIDNIFNEYKPEIVYHAAAHKHVPLMEGNPKEAVKNNIFGTYNVVTSSDKHQVESFVMVSTDKAVNPPNIMGATKRWAEMIVQNYALTSSTKFVAVRFGNVLGSRGSVIPLFKKQIEKGGPVTVTHPDITRYFMTIPEASRLVIQAGVLAKGGEVFVLDMGSPVKIVNLAKNVIELAGYTVDEIGIEFTGLRPGEKMYEELLNENEVSDKQVHEKIYVGKAAPMPLNLLLSDLNKLKDLNNEELKAHIIKVANTKFK